MEEERENGITFGEIFRMVKRRFLAILLASALVTAAAVALVALVINPSSTCYSLTFALATPAASSQQYADGTPFYYSDMISEEALAAAKESDDRFSGLDTEQMLESDAISVSSSTDGESNSRYLGVYTLRVKGKYFSDAEEAGMFLRALADGVLEKLRSSAAALDYSVEHAAYQAASLEERLYMLRSLRSTLMTGYDSWVSRYSYAYIVTIDGVSRTLGNYRAETSVLLGSSLQESLAQECEQGGYGPIVLSAGSEEEIEAAVAAERASLKAEYTLNASIISSFRGGGTASESLLEEYLVRNATIASQIGAFALSDTDDGSGSLSSANVKAFAETLDVQYAALNAAARTLKDVTTAIYEGNTWATYETRAPLAEGDVNVFLAGAAAFVVSFLFAACIVCATEYPKMRAAQEGGRISAEDNVPLSAASRSAAILEKGKDDAHTHSA